MKTWREPEEPHSRDPISASPSVGAAEAADEPQQLPLIKETGGTT